MLFFNYCPFPSEEGTITLHFAYIHSLQKAHHTLRWVFFVILLSWAFGKVFPRGFSIPLSRCGIKNASFCLHNSRKCFAGLGVFFRFWFCRNGVSLIPLPKITSANRPLPPIFYHYIIFHLLTLSAIHRRYYVNLVRNPIQDFVYIILPYTLQER